MSVMFHMPHWRFQCGLRGIGILESEDTRHRSPSNGNCARSAWDLLCGERQPICEKVR